MSFNIVERSRSRARKVTMYLFRYGSAAGSFYAFTDHTKPITRGGVTYTPVPIKRGKIVLKSNLDKSKLEIRTSILLEIGELFRIYPPTQVVTVEIREGHLSDDANEYRMIWSGRVTSVTRESPELILGCEPLRTSTRRLGLRRYFQYTCPHVLFSTSCRASKSAATAYATVASINGTTVTLVAGWTGWDHSLFTAGSFEWADSRGDLETRSIMKITGDTITLSGLVRDLSPGQPVNVIRACSHTVEGCHLHSNILNFGGCFAIPKKSPVGRTSVFY